MDRKFRVIPKGDHITEINEYRVTLTDIPSDGSAVVPRQFAFIKEALIDGMFTGILACGPLPFQKLRMFHNGTAWQIDLEAVEEKS